MSPVSEILKPEGGCNARALKHRNVKLQVRWQLYWRWGTATSGAAPCRPSSSPGPTSRSWRHTPSWRCSVSTSTTSKVLDMIILLTSCETECCQSYRLQSNAMLVASICVSQNTVISCRENITLSDLSTDIHPFHYKKNVVFVKIPLRVVNAVRIVRSTFFYKQ